MESNTKSKKIKLYNTLNKEEAKKILIQENVSRLTLSFYKYFLIQDAKSFRDKMYLNMVELKVLGRIYVSKEGINAQLSIPESNFERFKEYIYSIESLNNIILNTAIIHDNMSYLTLKIKVRNKIVADGIQDDFFDFNNRGKYVSPEEFNIMSEQENTYVVDMRNHYEYEIGHFKNAIEIASDTFRQQLNDVLDVMKEKKDSNIIMYCTGGIRCEKASAWLLYNGFKKVYHLEGGIINYTNQVRKKNLENKFLGKNFVFDNRLSEKIDENIISHCHQCGELCDSHFNCLNSGCHMLFIQCDNCKSRYNNCCSSECMNIIALPEEEQKKLRKGLSKGQNIFNKSKQLIDLKKISKEIK